MLRCICVFVSLLLCIAAGAESVVIDNFDDLNYTSGAAMGDKITISPAASKSEGNGAVQITYNYGTGGSWTKVAGIEKTFPLPVDLKKMEYITLDYLIPEANSGNMLVILLGDSKGASLRFTDYTFFQKPTPQWATKAYKLSDLVKSQWIGNGSPLNLGKISKITYQIINNGKIQNPGILTFSLDNTQAHANINTIKEKVILPFDNFTDNNEFSSRWKVTGKNNGTAALDTTAAFSGTKSMLITSTFTEKWTNTFCEYKFEAPLNFDSVRYFRLAICGHPSLDQYSPIISLYLCDSSGKEAFCGIRNWCATGQWEEIYMPLFDEGIEYFVDSNWKRSFQGKTFWTENRWDGKPWDQKTDLSKIQSVKIAVMVDNCQGTTVNNAMFKVDNLVAGYVTDAYSNYNVASSATNAQVSQQQMQKAPQASWYYCKEQIIKDNIRSKKPTILYFRKTGLKKCEEFEVACLLSNDFNMRAGSFSCMYEDSAYTSTIASLYGAFRVPDLLILNSSGQIFKRFQGNINQADVYAAMDQCQ